MQLFIGGLGLQEIFVLFFLLPFLIVIPAMWVLFQKAGKPGWAILIPIYGSIVMADIVKKPWYWGILMILPYIGWIWSIWSLNLLVKAFGKGEAYTIGCIFLPFIFLPMLAFNSENRYLLNDNLDFSHSGALDHGIR